MTTTRRYVDPAFLARELDRVFGRAWLVVTRGERVAKPGDVSVFDEVGRALIVIRGDDGRARVFHNACRHRASRLVERDGHLDSIRCRYHGWTYNRCGALVQAPRAAGFDAFDTSRIGLEELPSVEWAGFVWTSFDANAPPLDRTLAAIPADVAPYALEEMVTLVSETRVLPCNWKALLDVSLESYHLDVVHARSIARMVNETRQSFARFGDHQRMIVEVAPGPHRSWLDERTSRGGPYTEDQRRLLHRYFVFPNLILNVLPYHLTVFQVFPVGTSRARLHYTFALRRGARGLEAWRGRATALFSRFVLREDLPALDRFQRGVERAPETELRFHREEEAVRRFHEVLDEWLGGTSADGRAS